MFKECNLVNTINKIDNLHMIFYSNWVIFINIFIN